MDRLDQFVQVSVRLTGVDRIELLGAGAAGACFDTLAAAVSAAVLDEFLTALCDSDGIAVTWAMSSDRLGPVARNRDFVDPLGNPRPVIDLSLIGSGSFPTMGTSNPTLTIAAMAIRTADHLAKELGA